MAPVHAPSGPGAATIIYNYSFRFKNEAAASDNRTKQQSRAWCVMCGLCAAATLAGHQTPARPDTPARHQGPRPEPEWPHCFLPASIKLRLSHRRRSSADGPTYTVHYISQTKPHRCAVPMPCGPFPGAFRGFQTSLPFHLLAVLLLLVRILRASCSTRAWMLLPRSWFAARGRPTMSLL